MSDDPHPLEPDDSEPFDPDNEEMFESLVNRLRRIAIHCCHLNVQAAEELAGEASLRLHREKPWRRPEYSTYGGVIAWLTVVTKNIRNRKYSRQKRRDALRPEVEAKFSKSENELAENEFADTENRMYLEEVMNALKGSPAFVGKENVQRLLHYEFVENLTHEEVAKALGKTPRQLTKFKRKVYDAIPRELLFRLFRRIRNKK